MTDVTTMVQDQVLESIKTLEGATLDVIKGWTKVLATPPGTGESAFTPKLDTFYGFAEKMWTTQKHFMVSLLEVATEAGKAVPDTMKNATQRAANAAKP